MKESQLSTIWSSLIGSKESSMCPSGSKIGTWLERKWHGDWLLETYLAGAQVIFLMHPSPPLVKLTGVIKVVMVGIAPRASRRLVSQMKESPIS